MSAPTVQLLMWLNASPAVGGYFILDDPSAGVLDSAPYSLAPGVSAVDVSAWLTGSISGQRGRSREIDAYQAGQLSFTLRNEDRRFDPSYSGSPYYPGILPRTKVQLLVAGSVMFTGFVSDYNVQYEKPNIATVTVSAQDVFALLATTTILGFNAPQQTTGTRVSAILSRPEVGFSGASTVDTGVFTMQASTVHQVTALDHLHVAADTEGGQLFVLNDGTLRFADQNYIANQIAATPAGQVTFADDGTGIGYQQVGMHSGVALLFNEVQGTRSGGVTQVVDNLTSQSLFGIRALTLPSLENALDSDVASLCTIYLNRYATPEVRFDTVAVELSANDGGTQTALCGLDLSAVVQVVRSPSSGPPIDQIALVEQIAWALDVSQSQYQLTFGLGNALEAGRFFIVGDPVQGVLDQSTYVLV